MSEPWNGIDFQSWDQRFTIRLMGHDHPHTAPQTVADYRAEKFAMNLSLTIGFAMLVMKCGAYWMTGSAAILSDAAESVVHVVGVGFASFSLWLSFQPPDKTHPYGHDRISFFSAGIEGGLIIAAAIFILIEAGPSLLSPEELPSLDIGTGLVALAGAINGFLGWYLVRTGKRRNNLILVANGKHVLTDTWTSIGVVGGLVLVLFTGYLRLDPLLAILVACNILWSGGHLVKQSLSGLMDQVDPEVDRTLRKILSEAEAEGYHGYHELRHRNTGRTYWVEVHLLFDGSLSLRDSHRVATRIESQVGEALEGRVIVTTHLEPEEQSHVHEHDQDGDGSFSHSHFAE
jgi:cation diffusion facilitator family transporter